MSVKSLPEQEIQRRIQLGFITPSLNGSTTIGAAASSIATFADQAQSEEWQDITDQEVMQESADGHDDDPTETENSMDDINNQNPYSLDTHRRSSIDLGHLTLNRHDDSVSLMSSTATSSNHHGSKIVSTTNCGLVMESVSNHHSSNKRLRYRQPSIASISEEEQVPSIAGTNNDTSINVLMDNENDDDDEVATVDGNDEDIMEDC